MELSTVGRPRSSRSHQGTLKSRRHSSPDSACEQASGPDDPSEEREGRRKGALKKQDEDVRVSKGAVCQDSDVDSGIVTCRIPGQRIGSTSSADTDSSQESRRKVEYSPPIQKSSLPAKSINGSQRIKHSSGPGGGPVIGDHSVLKECNRRPPTPLSVFPESQHCVRFDDQLHLSEQNIRRSCRKLFATLYAQRFSYPSHQSSARRLPSREPDYNRIRSHTIPELDLRRPNSSQSSIRSNKENLSERTPVQGRRASLGWTATSKSSSGLSTHKSNSDLNLNSKLSSSIPQRNQFPGYNMHVIDQKDRNSCRTASTDSGIGSSKSTQCTCPSRPSTQYSSSQSSGSYNCNCVCNCSKTLPRSVHRPQLGLIKSNSCSTLTAMMSRPHSSARIVKKTSPVEAAVSRSSKGLQKTSSCSNLMDKVIPEYCSTKNARRTSLQVGNHTKSDECLQKTSSCSNLEKSTNYHVTNVYSDNMIHAYARMASVVPEDLKSTTLQRPRVLGRSSYRTENIYDTIRSSTITTTSSLSPDKVNPQIGDLYSTTQLKSPELVVPQTKVQLYSEIKSMPSAEIYSQIASNGYGSYGLDSSRQSAHSRAVSAQRPKSVGVVTPNCSPVHVYLKPALKKTTQFQNQTPKTESQTSLSGEITEVEYAVVDKSKKSRFTSLPVLNGHHMNGSISEEADEKDPPVPPKKLLNKSDFSLHRSRSSSPGKKSLLSRVQTLSRNAKSALQKAFSTERIYRPEREERLEGQKTLRRSRSFVKTLTGSFRRKKKRNLVAEVVPQASSNPQWDETPLGPNDLIHVRGQLLQLNLDGSQVVELTKPPSKPYGFFVARGRVRNSKGIFVSRMRDQETQKQLAGILDIGDEILEIEGASVKNSDIMEVNNLMANKNTLLLTVLPYICRKDI